MLLKRVMRPGHPTHSRGYTIIELMVAITLSLIILAGLVTLFAGNSRERHAIERANQQTEDGRYALQVIGDDLRNAGYLTTFNPGAFNAPNPQLAIPAALPDPCATDLPTLNSAMVLAVQGYYNVTALTAPACVAGDVRAGTDIVVVRRASTCAVGTAGCDPQVAGDVYLQASGCPAEFTAGTYYALDSNLGNLNLHLKDCATAAPRYQYRTHIYFVANNDQPGDGIPTLMRAELGPGAFSIVPLAEGVENLHLEYGLDTSVPTTGTVAAYSADPNTYIDPIQPCATPPVCYWGNTVEAKIYVLTRDLTPTQGYADTKTYTLGLNAANPPVAIVLGAFGDGYRRHLYSTVARLNNPAGRNSP